MLAVWSTSNISSQIMTRSIEANWLLWTLVKKRTHPEVIEFTEQQRCLPNPTVLLGRFKNMSMKKGSFWQYSMLSKHGHKPRVISLPADLICLNSYIRRCPSLHLLPYLRIHSSSHSLRTGPPLRYSPWLLHS